MTKKKLNVSDLQANSKLSQEGEHQIRMVKVHSSMKTEDNEFGTDSFFLSRSKASDANVANFV